MKHSNFSACLALLLLIGCEAPLPPPDEPPPRPRVFVVGVDALSWRLVDPLLEAGEMPTLTALRTRGLTAELETVEPPISPVNWTSISTGRSPEAHGVTTFFQNRRDVQVPTTWERLAAAGKKVGLYDDLITWPPRELPDGFMIPGWLRRDDRLEPPDVFVRAGIAEPYLYRVIDFGDQDAILANLRRELTEKPGDFRRLVEGFDLDVAFTTFFAVDVASHNFFHTLDPKIYPEPIPTAPHHADALRDIVRGVDGALGEIVAGLRPNDHLLIVSDHGVAPQIPPDRKWAYHADRLLALAGIPEDGEVDIISGFLSAAYAFSDAETADRLARLLRGLRVAESGAALFEVWEVERSEESTAPAWQVEMMRTRPAWEHFVFAAVRPEIADATWPGGALLAASGTSRRIDEILHPHEFTGDHDPIGFFLAIGPAIAPRAERTRLSVLDIAPLVFYLAGEPIPDDLEGRLDSSWITPEYLAAHRPRTIAADQVPRLAEEAAGEDESTDEEVERRLRALGYLD